MCYLHSKTCCSANRAVLPRPRFCYPPAPNKCLPSRYFCRHGDEAPGCCSAAAVDQLAVKRGRGRPKGSKTKLKRFPGEELQQFRTRKATSDAANRKPPTAEEASRTVENLEDAARGVDNAGKRVGDLVDNAAAECMLPPKSMKRIAGPVAKACREAW